MDSICTNIIHCGGPILCSIHFKIIHIFILRSITAVRSGWTCLGLHPLHNHSHFSFMDGLSRPEDMVIRAKEKGLRSIALTDHGHMHGIADIFLSGKKHDMRTIYGVEAYIIDSLQKWKEEKSELEKDKESLKLLKKSQAKMLSL